MCCDGRWFCLTINDELLDIGGNAVFIHKMKQRFCIIGQS